MQFMNKFNPAEKTLVVGGGSFIRGLLTEIRRQPGCRYRIAGIVVRGRAEEAGDYGCPVLGTVNDLHLIIRQQHPEVIIVEPPGNSAGLADRQLLDARVLQHVRIEHAHEVYERVTGKLPLEALAPEDFIYSTDFQPGRLALASARVLSLGLACAGLMLLAPLMLLIALLIRIDSPGPVFFVQERSGLAGRRFRLLKFRTMLTSDEQESEWEEGNLHRITRVGRWLRKSRLDELPQFINVLRGDMNIVGPRPHPASNFELFVLAARNAPESGLQIPYYSMRSSVRPGITGWAQVRYRYANNLHEELEKLRFDLYYLKHYSLWLDIRILFGTVWMVFARRQHSQDLPLIKDVAADVTSVTETILPAAGKATQQSEQSRHVA